MVRSVSAYLLRFDTDSSLSTKMLALVSSSFVTALSFYTSYVYGVGLDWTDMLTLIVKSLQGNVPTLQQSELQVVLAILAIIGIVETAQFILSAFHGGLYGVMFTAVTFISTLFLLSISDTTLMALLGVVIAIVFVIAYWYEPLQD